ncbi:energy-coupling factor transporter transmembrane protein EcfT [Leucobacter allii]|uniref:energy-coupling factor transporter transmembrane component T family protein n=1 Tax=Leucobacter allii TaxID=2932247 RepID=UPI001FD433BE|nr:energy-coupling factor transporter transmembrane component T [Leucobacter allii]UOR01674.1 energy-coupling factor transporter transmembrane protein EcfT [Leucobacter allii]
MSAPSPLGAYLPRDGPLHRMRPGAKLLGLFLFAIVVVASGGPWLTSAWLGIGLVLAALAGLRGRRLWRAVRGFAFVAVPLLLFTAVSRALALDGGWGSGGPILPGAAAWTAGAVRGYEVVGDLLAVVLAASAVTASTAVTDVLETVTGLLGPLRRFGVRPERVALACSLLIRAIPSILEIAAETRAAARARGLERDPRALVVPLVLRTVAHAQLTGEALAARGIGEEEDDGIAP